MPAEDRLDQWTAAVKGNGGQVELQARQVIKMQWPARLRTRNDTSESLQPAPSRPPTVVELIARILETDKSSAIFLKTVSGLMVVGTACFVVATVCIIAIALAVHFAAKGIKLPQHEILPFGLGGASLLTLVTILVRRWIRKLLKASRGDEDGDHTPDGKQ